MKQLFKATLLGAIFLGFVSCTESTDQAVGHTFKRTANEVVVRIESEPDRLNPLLTALSESVEVIGNIHLYLLFPNNENYAMEPQLAVDRPTIKEITDGPYKGGISLEFEIHEEAVWDDGRPVTGKDFEFAVKLALHPKIPADIFRPYFSYLKDIEIDPQNPKRFTIISYPKYINAEAALSNNIPPLPAHILDPKGILTGIPMATFTDEKKIAALVEENPALTEFATTFQEPKFSRSPEGVVGCGPYRLVSWESGQELVLEKKEDWWGNTLMDDFPKLAAFPDRIVYKIIPNASTALAALKAEEIDAITNIRPTDFLEMQSSELINDLYNLHTVPDFACYYIHTNTKSPKLQDKLVRQALAHAVNVDEILNQLYHGFGQRVNAPLPPTSPAYNKSLPIISYDPEKAKALLAEAGWTDTNNNGVVDKVIDGNIVELELTYFHSPGREISINTALLFQDMAKAAGIKITPVAQDFSTSVGKARNGEFELMAAGQQVQYVNWEPKQRWHSEATNGGTNYSGFSTPETDAIIEEIQTTFDEDRRNELYKELQRIIYDAQPVIFMFEPTNRIAIHKRFEADLTSMRPGYSVNQFQMVEQGKLN